MLNVKYRLILAARALIQWLEGTGLGSTNEKPRGQHTPAGAPCGGHTPKDRQYYHKIKLKLLLTSYLQRI